MRLRDLQQALRPLMARVRSLVARASITRVVDGGLSQQVQITVLAGERLDQVVRLQNFGLTANPPAGSTALLLSMGGSRTHCVVIGADHASRPRDLAPGEAQLYNQWGDFVHLRESGETLVKARSKIVCEAPVVHAVASTKVLLETPLVETTQHVRIGGDLRVAGASELVGNVEAGADVTVIGAIEGATVADADGALGEIRDTFNTHVHSGVMAGAGNTAIPTTPMS